MRRSTTTMATIAATALVASSMTFAALPAKADLPACTAGATEITVFGFNDFHGRVIDDGARVDDPARYLAGRLFTPVEQARSDGDNVLLISQGDNIGASTFVSMIGKDKPTLDVLNAVGVDVSTVGNHEFDTGWADFRDNLMPQSNFNYLGANVYEKGTENVVPELQEYELFDVAGVTIAVVGAVTGDVPSLVSPAGIQDIDFGDPVAAVNRVTSNLLDADPANGEADVVLASFHEGAADGTSDAASNAADSDAFAAMFNDVDPRVTTIFNGHTHQTYDWTTDNGQPIMQASSYAAGLSQLTLKVNADGQACAATSAFVKAPAAADASLPAIAEVLRISDVAYDEAMELGKEVVGKATAAISTPDGSANIRDVESPMSNMVAQMFADMLSDGDESFIGIQNPGGTRASFDAGDIAYREAALTLPFANSLFTTQITGAQFKTVLEQQWQRDANGNVPSRPFLQLGLSDNVSYTFDESRPEGDRITSISINGAPIEPETLYTVGSGSFLIAGGDNFRELANGVNTRDTGRADLEAWTEWLFEQDEVSPDYRVRGVSVLGSDDVSSVKDGKSATLVLGDTLAGGIARQTLDLALGTGDNVTPQLANTTVTATLDGVEVGTASVVDGKATVKFTVPKKFRPADGSTATLKLVAEESGTTVTLPVRIGNGNGNGNNGNNGHVNGNGNKPTEHPGNPNPGSKPSEKPGNKPTNKPGNNKNS